MKSRLLLLSFLSLLWSCGNRQTDEAVEKILHLADRRVPAQELAAFLQHPDKTVQKQAIVALGRMLDTTAVPLLLPFLQNKDDGLRSEAVFALGQLGTRPAVSALLDLWAAEKDVESRAAILQALGKTAGAEALPVLHAALRDPLPLIRGEAALALGIMGYRKVSLPSQLPQLSPLLKENLPEVRWRAVYALMRLHDSTAAPWLEKALQDRDARVRMHAARGLGVIRAAWAAGALARTAATDSDWRVRVNAVSALGNIAPDRIETLLPLRDENEHVRLAAWQALETAFRRNPPPDKRSAKIEALLSPYLEGRKDSWRVQAAAANVYARLRKNQALARLAALRGQPQPYFRARLAEALGKTGNPKAVPVLEELFQQGPGVVRVAAVSAAANFPVSAVKNLYRTALAQNDAVLTALVAERLAGEKRPSRALVQELVGAFRRLPRPLDVEAAGMIFRAFARLQWKPAVPLLEKELKVPDRPYAVAAARALESLTGKSYRDALPRETRPAFDFTLQEIRALRGKTAILTTEKGEIEIELFPEDAPLTTLNFVRLAKKGFYDGLNFHRVVPNFVIQGGDPRGDSWGSPGYSIRSEYNRRRYFRGMVGMASAGPDTEGCQFFITHSAQPHLDGRYTVFGRVKKGRDVVDRIQVGDRILRVEIR